MVDIRKIQNSLEILDAAYPDANPEDEFGNFTEYRFILGSFGHGHIEASFYYSTPVSIIFFDNLAVLDKELNMILDGTSQWIGYPFDVDEID